MYFAFKVHNKIVDGGGAIVCIDEVYRYLTRDNFGIDKLYRIKQSLSSYCIRAENEIRCHTLGVDNVNIKFRAIYGLPK